MLVKPAGRVMDSSLVQLRKAWVPMLVTVAGMLTVAMLLQL